MKHTWDIKQSNKAGLIEITFHDGALTPDGKWKGFDESILGILDIDKDEGSHLFDSVVWHLIPQEFSCSCAQWTHDQRFFFPKAPAYVAHNFKQSRDLIQSVFKSDWGAGWGTSPDILFVSSSSSPLDDDEILRDASLLKQAHLGAENQNDEAIAQIAKSYDRILYVQDYLLGFIKCLSKDNDPKDVLQSIEDQILTAAQPFNLQVPRLSKQTD